MVVRNEKTTEDSKPKAPTENREPSYIATTPHWLNIQDGHVRATIWHWTFWRDLVRNVWKDWRQKG